MSAPVDNAVDSRVAKRALARYGFGPASDLRMINLSENATFLVHEQDRSAIVRVHRMAYHSRSEIESELMWLSALNDDTEVVTPDVLPNADGDLVTTVDDQGAERHVVLFNVVPGSEPDDLNIRVSDFETLGAITARMHLHARSWTPPARFRRFRWDWDSALGDHPRWGRWQDGIGVGPTETAPLEAAAQIVSQKLKTYGTASDRFGLVHADLRLANLLLHDDLVTVIDFDDSGYSWFMYDFGTAVSFIEHDPRLPDWQDAWLRGYRSVTELSTEHEAMLTTFVMMRRLMLVAWMGSHSHSRECQELGPGYTAGTVDLARRYVASAGTYIN